MVTGVFPTFPLLSSLRRSSVFFRREPCSKTKTIFQYNTKICVRIIALVHSYIMKSRRMTSAMTLAAGLLAIGTMITTPAMSWVFPVGPTPTTRVLSKSTTTTMTAALWLQQKQKPRRRTRIVVSEAANGDGGDLRPQHGDDEEAPKGENEKKLNNKQKKEGTTITTTSSHQYPILPSIPPTIKEEHRYSANDWLHNMYSLPRSTILREIKVPVMTIMIWSMFVSVLLRLVPRWGSALSMPSTPHSFLVSALGLLLVFRTNSAYQRFSEGRRIWEQILSVSRNLTRYASLYEGDVGRTRRLRMFRLLGAFPYLLHSHITAMDSTNDTNNDNNDQRTSNNNKNQELPWSLFPPKARAKCAASSNQPLWICDRLAKEVINVPYNDNFTSRERSTFLSQIDKLSQCVGECERIHQTAVPQNYARHSLRSLTIWLWTLPFCLVKDFGLWTGPVMGVTSWLLFGVYQIGASIEDPFKGSLRLRSLCDAIYRDVMYEEIVPLASSSSAILTSTTQVPTAQSITIAADNETKAPTKVSTIKTNHRETAYQLEDELQEWKALKRQSMPRP